MPVANPPADHDLRVAPVLVLDSSSKQKETTAWIGMVLFLASWGMMFGALFFMYGGIRARAINWPPQGLPAIPLTWPLVNTFVIALSSFALQTGVWSIRKGHQTRLNWSLFCTLGLGLLFMSLQWELWTDIYAMGLMPSSGFYGSVFYGMTWIHAAHVVIGLVALLWLCFFAIRGRYTAPRHLSLRLWAMYWHFVGVVWVIMFVTVFLV